ncbi:SAM-dependent methyltransferase [Geomonas silvestris]|uniref:SAM-dependent methyltransferase n=1 Tax=Geomonas silvestris TaxID=2740184 RepID=A0A6V8MQ60_9BACT|nr:class I SAM-dependent methyltransferase [Geomonas silvestris]GFO61853.1 SAM-dependent methyltransferase [Geomonas silvestris]
MEEDRIKWDERYTGDSYFFCFAPSGFLARCFETVRPLVPGLRAIDLACGEGRNAIYLAQHGFRVTAVDISPRGLERGERRAAEVGVSVDFVQADLEAFRFDERYDLILDFNFLLRPLIPLMVAALNPGGVIVMETILDTPSIEPGHTKSFLLQPGELVQLFEPFAGTVHLFEEEAKGPTPVARIIFQKAG